MAEYSNVCFFKVVGGVDDESLEARKSVANAIQNNPRNGSITIPVSSISLGPTSGPLQLAIFSSKLWSPGRELKVAFLSGSEWQKQKVKQYAPQWCQYANIKFAFDSPGDPDILIDFNPNKGSWSYLGTDCGWHSSKNQPSMNLGWIVDRKTEADIRGVILHEFGHALGAVHEHESPRANIPWNKEVVYRDLGGDPNYWDRTKVDQNMFTVYTTEQVQATAFDGNSIMLYYFPPSWTTDGKGTTFNTELSERDKAYIKFCYPTDSLDAGQFNTQEIRPWNQPAQRYATEKYFHTKYPSTPGLALGLNWLDIDGSRNIRINALAEDVTDEKFTAVLDTWSDTILYSAGMTWLEVGPKFNFIQTGNFNTQDVRAWSNPQLQTSKRIEFSTQFQGSPPTLVCFLTSLDMSNDKNWRVKAYATDVNLTGFTIHVDSWSDSILYSAGVTWIAYPANIPGVASGRFSTSDIRPWNQPQQDNSSQVTFGKAFSHVPKVLMALDELDYDHGKNLRLRVSTSSVDPTGFQWHLQTWADSVMWSSGASYFAWE